MRRFHFHSAGLFALAMVALFTSCAGPGKTAAHQSARFTPAEVDQITVLPVVDLRQDKTVDIDLTHIVHGRAKSLLKSKKYEVLLSSDPSAVAGLTEEDLRAKDCPSLEHIQPTGARWIMVFAVHDVTRKLTFGSTGGAELTGYFFDRQNGEQLWRDKGVGRAGQGGLLGMAMIGMMSGEALRAAANDCLITFPSKRRK
jgi:hypothetical protein